MATNSPVVAPVNVTGIPQASQATTSKTTTPQFAVPNQSPMSTPTGAKQIATSTPGKAMVDLMKKRTAMDNASASMQAQAQLKNPATVSTAGVNATVGATTPPKNDVLGSSQTANPGLDIAQKAGNGYYDKTGNFFEGKFDSTGKFIPASSGQATGGTGDVGATGTANTAEKTPATPEQQIEANNLKIDEAYNKYKSDIDSIRNGTFALAPDQQAQIDYIKSTFERAKTQQMEANRNYTAGVGQAGIASGRNRYAPELALGEIKGAIDQGVQKIADLDAQAANEIAKMRSAFMKDDLEAINSAFDKFQKYMSDKNSTIQKIADSARAHEEFTLNYTRQSEKDNLDYAKSIAPGIVASVITVDKDGNVIVPTEAEIAELSKQYGVNSALISGEVQKRIDELNKLSREELKLQAEFAKPVAIDTDADGKTIYGVYDRATKSYTPISFSSTATGGTGQVDPIMLNWAYVAMSTGQVPSGLTRSQGNQVLALARELPKPKGMVYDVFTGLKSAKLNATQEDGVIGLNASIDKAKELQGLLKNWIVTPANVATYDSLRTQLLSELLRAKSGAAVTEQEYARLASLIPTVGEKYKNIFGTADARLEEFIKGSNQDLDAKLSGYGVDIAGRVKPGDSATLKDFYATHPDLVSDIEQKAIENDWNEEELLQYANAKARSSQSFNNVGGDTNRATVKNIASAIGQFESGGRYDAKGVVVTKGAYKGERALGKYQVMPGNVPAWTKEALGYSMTPEQFLSSPQAQDAVAEYKMGKLYAQYGNIEDVASVWFSGKPLKKAGNAKDDVGTSVPQYVKNVSSIYNNLT